MSERHLNRIVLGVQYDGSPWQGWQSQVHGLTVQDRLQSALQSFLQETVTVHCAGRTDSGVHALEQVVHLDTALTRDRASWVRGVNAFLPPSIAVRWAEQVNPEFHARRTAVKRTYQYVLYNHPVRSPLLTGKAGWFFRPLSLEKMQEAANYLLGEHDFSAFRASQCQALTPVKTMHTLSIAQRGDFFIFNLCANAFLHHMVRNIVGSLVYVGKGACPPEWMRDILLLADRKNAAPTFMPDGLYLSKVSYPEQWNLPQEASFLPFA